VDSAVYVIAEAGVNHNGSLELAADLVRAAKAAGADSVKFQAFSADALATRAAGKAAYQAKATGEDEPQLDMLRKLELDESAHLRLQGLCAEEGIDFLSSAFDLESVAMLGRLGLAMHKIPSGEITNLPYLRAVAALGTPIMLSTGMAEMSEVGDALNELVAAGTPRRLITVLHCSTEYPAPYEDVNLLAMVSIRDEFGVAVGYSDHTEGITVPVAAVALGARVIEKHLTLDRGLPGPDHAASLEPAQFAEMVSAIRDVETALGDGVKRPFPAELANRDVVRKSIVASRPIATGEVLSAENLTTKRPGSGMSPMRWDEVMGTAASRAFEADEEVEL
jgi:N,N'-diacetyllegionaminate synthase